MNVISVYFLIYSHVLFLYIVLLFPCEYLTCPRVDPRQHSTCTAKKEGKIREKEKTKKKLKNKHIFNRTCTYDSKHRKYKFTGKLTTTMANLIIAKADIQKKPKTMKILLKIFYR